MAYTYPNRSPTPKPTFANLVATGKENHFKSENFPDPYPPNQDFCWFIRTDSGSGVIRLNLDEFKLEESPECIKDYVKLYDGVNCTSSPSRILCGKVYENIVSKSSSMCINFRSDATENARGFKIAYAEVEKSDTAVIVGLTLLGVGILTVLILIVFYVLRKKNAIRPMSGRAPDIEKERVIEQTHLTVEPPQFKTDEVPTVKMSKEMAPTTDDDSPVKIAEEMAPMTDDDSPVKTAKEMAPMADDDSPVKTASEMAPTADKGDGEIAPTKPALEEA